jgi:hypothetical protein
MEHKGSALNLELLWLGRLVPRSCPVLVIGKDGVRLAEGLGDDAWCLDLNEATDCIAPTTPAPIAPEVVVLVGGIEKYGAHLSLIELLASSGISLIYGFTTERTERESVAGELVLKHFDVIRFELRDEMGVCFAAPHHRPLGPVWLQPHVDKLRKRFERHQARLSARGENSEGGRVFGTSWERRDRFVTEWIPKGLSVADVGCGAMTAEKLLLPRAYLPIDIERWDERTWVLDLNAVDMPAHWLTDADLVLFLGVLEYLEDPLRHLGQIAGLSKRMVVSYNVFEKRSRLKQATAGRWKSSLSDEDLRRAFAGYRYDIEASVEMGRQMLYLIKPEGAPPLKATRANDEAYTEQG